MMMVDHRRASFLSLPGPESREFRGTRDQGGPRGSVRSSRAIAAGVRRDNNFQLTNKS
jgi:hypothetical protein